MASPSDVCDLILSFSSVLRALFAPDNVATSRESELVYINGVLSTFTYYGDGAERGGEHLGVEVVDLVSYQRQGVQACEVSQGVRRFEINVICIQIELLQCHRDGGHSLQVFCPRAQVQESRQLGEGLRELFGIAYAT